MDEETPQINGHVEENTTEVSSNGSDTKVVTKTTTVTETQVITEISGKKISETVTNGSGSQENSNQRVSVEEKVEKKKSEKKEESGSTTVSPNKNGSAQEIGSGGEELKSPNKVKKQKSFKKTLMKKFKKEEK